MRTLSFLVFAISILLFSCNSEPEEKQNNQAFTKYIDAYTSGYVSSQSSVKIQLRDPYKGIVKYGEPVDMDLFDFKPSIDGKAVWVDQQTIEFVPSEKLKSGKTYTVDFHLGKLFELPERLETFKFRFDVIIQSIDLSIEGLKTYNNESIKWQQLQGKVIAADVIEEEELHKTIEVLVNGTSYKTELIPDSYKRIFTFQVDSIERKEDAGNIIVKWDGSKIGVDGKGELEYEIPALGDFKVVDVDIIQVPEQYVIIRFSDPINTQQDLTGLVYIEGQSDVRRSVETNELRLYPGQRLVGEQRIFVSSSVKNSIGYKLKEDLGLNLRFEAIKPEIRLVGKGNVLPSSNGLVFPFEAVSLKAVDVKIIKIYSNNIIQFFQNNNFNGESGLKRVGRLIRKKTVQLESEKSLDYGTWNRYSIDLEDYIKADPGAIYQVILSFRKHHSTYLGCSLEEDVSLDETDWDEYDDAESGNWDYQNDYSHSYYYNNYFSGYSYRERDNPCSYSYFRDKSVSRNIFASDIGIVAKCGTNGSMNVALSNLISTEPVSGAEIKVYDYQQQEIAKLTSDNNGLAKVDKLSKKPFFIVARKDNQIAYLRLDNGSSLPLSRFDVQGSTVNKGLKGFLYGERGVWRPGDSLFLTFILQDEELSLPQNHPVIFTLTNPKGQLVERVVRTASLNNFYSFITKTEMDAPTGNWTANVSVGGTSFSKNIKIETIKPNRLKIKLNFDSEILSASQKTIAGDLQVNWLHGAPGKNLKADISVKFINAPTVFKHFETYSFSDPIKEFYPNEETIYEGKLDENGKTRVLTKLNVSKNVPGMLKAVFKTRAYESGGEFSTDQFSIPYAPYNTFIGIRAPETNRWGALETGKPNLFDVVSVDERGNPVSVDNLRVEVYKIEWRWWWQRDRNNIGNYIGRNGVTPVISKVISTDDKGMAQFDIKMNKNDWGRYLIRVSDIKGGHATGTYTYFDWPDWMSRSGRKNPDGANMLSFSADKEKYNVGEKAQISFPSSKGAKALVSIEDGKKVLDVFWLDTDDSETKFDLPITKEHAPNCYVNITLIQPHNQTENDAPIRMYGVIPLMVEDANTKLDPVIEMPKKLAPEKQFTVKVSEQDGKPMTYTLAIVDEGLLDITRFKTPAPWHHFYAREALGVKTWDIYDWVIGAYGAKIENILSVGGDGNLKPAEEKAIRFKPVVKFVGPFHLDANESREHQLTMPNYIGSVRAMLIAGQNNAYGSTEKTVPVKKPLMVLATLPRVLGPGEKVKLPVTVFAMEDHVKNVKVEVKTNSILKISGEANKEIVFNSLGDKVVNFDLEVAEKTGIAKVEILVSSGKEKSSYEIELDVRSPNLPIAKFSDAVVEAGKSWTKQLELHGLEGTNSAFLEISSIPPINLENRLSYLIRYPHGCIEQTTSSAFPQLFIGDVMDLTSDRKLKIQDNVMAAVQRIRRFQLSNGGFGYWPGASEASEWGSSYAGHFLIEAEKKGYNLPYGLKEKWINYQQSMARRWSPVLETNTYYYRNNDLDQAYRLYTLALAGVPELSAMNRLRESGNLENNAAWRLAAAYQIIGKNEVAQSIIRNLATNVQPYREMRHTYGSSIRDEAMIIETLTLMGEKAKAAPVVKTVSEKLNADYWMSTQTTAYALIAVSRFSKVNSSLETMNCSYTFNGESESIQTKLPLKTMTLDISGKRVHELNFENKGSDLLFVRLISNGVPLTGEEEDVSENLSVEVSYEDLSGKSISVDQIEQGTDFIANVRVSNPGIRGSYYEMSLSQIFPSGWEIHNSRMDEGDNLLKSDPFDYQDIRDDRVYTYFSLLRNSSKTFKVKLHAAYLGTYYLPPTRCEAMYDNSIQAQQKGQMTKVVKPGTME